MAKRDRGLYILLATQLSVTLAATAFAYWGAPALLAEHARFGAALPLLAKVGLLGWPLLSCAWLALAISLAALVRRGQRRGRLRVMSIALTVSAVAFVVLVMAGVLPLLAA